MAEGLSCGNNCTRVALGSVVRLDLPEQERHAQ